MQLQPASKAAGEADGAAPRKANPFGDAKPIDASAQVPSVPSLAHGTPTPTTPTLTTHTNSAHTHFRLWRCGSAGHSSPDGWMRVVTLVASLAEGPAVCTAQAEAEKRAEEKLRKEQEEAEAQRKVLPNLVFLDWRQF